MLPRLFHKLNQSLPFKQNKQRPFKTAAQQRGQQGEAVALAYLQKHGLVCTTRNYRCRGGEIDLIMRDASEDAETLVFVEVRSRKSAQHGSAAESVDQHKQRRLTVAAKHYLLTQKSVPACRFDVVALDGGQIEWIKNAFEINEI